MCVLALTLSLAGCKKVISQGVIESKASNALASSDEVKVSQNNDDIKSTESPDSEISDDKASTKDEVKPTEKVSKKNTEKSTKKATEKDSKKNTEKSTKKATDKSTEKSTEKPTDTPTEKPTEAPTEKSTENATEVPTEVHTEVPTEKPTEKTEYAVGETSKENPAPKGTWVDYKVRDYNTLEMFTTKVRVNKITTQSDDADYVKEVLDEYNDTHVVKLDTKNMSAKIEIVVADIEMKIPKKERVKDRLGAPHPISFDIVRPEGVEYHDKDGDKVKFVTYVGKFEEYSTTCSAGDTVKTKLIYGMVKGFNDYYIKVTSFSDFEGGDCNYAYLNIKKDVPKEEESPKKKDSDKTDSESTAKETTEDKKTK